MGIFNLTDFKFNTDKTNQSGPLDSLIDGPSKYAYDVYKYPIDLGNYDKGHYIVFHINEQVKTNFPGTQTNVDTAVSASQKSLSDWGVGATTVGD